MADEQQRRIILLRRARFIAAGLAGVAITAPAALVRADGGAGIEDAGSDADADTDAGDDAEASAPIHVDAGARDAGALAEPAPCLCAMPPAPVSEGGRAAAALGAAAALVAARRRKRR